MGALSYIFPLLGVASYAFALVFNYGAIAGEWFSDSDVGEVSDRYNTTLTPAGWTFGIWGIIYGWQATWLLYVTYLSLERINRGTLYFPKQFWLFYIAANLFNGTWIAVWLMEYVTLSMIVLFLIWINLALSTYFAIRYLTYDLPYAIRTGNQSLLDQYPQSLVLSYQVHTRTKAFIWCWQDEKQLLYAFVLNGIPLYATWTCVASCVMVSVTVRYDLEWIHGKADVVCGLAVLIALIFGYWYLDLVNYHSRKGLRYTYTPYFVLIWAFLGVLTNYSVSEYGSSVIILMLLILAGVASIVKIILGIRLIRENNSLLFQVNDKYTGYGNDANLTAV